MTKLPTAGKTVFHDPAPGPSRLHLQPCSFPLLVSHSSRLCFSSTLCALAPPSWFMLRPLCLASRSPGAEWAVSLGTDVYVAVHGLCMPKAPSMPGVRPRGDRGVSQLCHTSQPLLWKKAKVLVTQSCLSLCNPMDCSPPGSSVHGILQARILEWVAIPFSRESS